MRNTRTQAGLHAPGREQPLRAGTRGVSMTRGLRDAAVLPGHGETPVSSPRRPGKSTHRAGDSNSKIRTTQRHRAPPENKWEKNPAHGHVN